MKGELLADIARGGGARCGLRQSLSINAFLTNCGFLLLLTEYLWGLAFCGARTVVVRADEEEGEDVGAKGDFAGGVADFAGVAVADFGDEGAVEEEASSPEVG